MGQLVFILGRSGTGKSYSMRNFPKDKIAVVNVQGKILPFRGSGQIEMTCSDRSEAIVKQIEAYAKTYKSIVVDDYQYVMANEFMRRSSERGYDKFTEIGRHAWDIANAVRLLPNDVIVYVLCHVERDDDGNEKIKTIGKLLDEKICLEGMSTIVLKTNVTDGEYSFLTQNNGKDTVKSPAGMFPSYAIDNDLYYVDQKIRNYYGLGEFITDEEAKEIDEMAAKVDFEPRQEGEKKSRRKKKDEKEEKPAEAHTEEKKEETKSERRRRAAQANTNNDSESAESDAGIPDETAPAAEPRRRRRSVSADMEEERAAVAEANATAVANAGLDEAGENEEVPLEDVQMPDLKTPPRRKKRGVMNEPEQTSGEPEQTDQKEEEEKEPVQENNGEADSVSEEPVATGRRRRRRG